MSQCGSELLLQRAHGPGAAGSGDRHTPAEDAMVAGRVNPAGDSSGTRNPYRHSSI